jgi:hypothetical protein
MQFYLTCPENVRSAGLVLSGMARAAATPGRARIRSTH